jgi:hypothetical protein
MMRWTLPVCLSILKLATRTAPVYTDGTATKT